MYVYAYMCVCMYVFTTVNVFVHFLELSHCLFRLFLYFRFGDSSFCRGFNFGMPLYVCMHACVSYVCLYVGLFCI
jgi:hypothetical protein